MLETELLFVYIYCLVDDAIKAGALLIPRRPGPAPACTDAELLTIALVRHLLSRRSENRFLAEIRRDWLHLFPHLPHQSCPCTWPTGTVMNECTGDRDGGVTSSPQQFRDSPRNDTRFNINNGW
jgi:hypothetical protein